MEEKEYINYWMCYSKGVSKCDFNKNCYLVLNVKCRHMTNLYKIDLGENTKKNL